MENTMQQRNLKCYECEGEQCKDQHLPLCEDAVACLKAMSLGEDGKEIGSRGCISDPSQMRFFCNNHMHSSHRVAKFRIECCQGDVCNGGPFPLLPSPTTDDDITNTIRLIILMMGPMVGLFLMICGIYVYHRVNRSKNGSMSIKQSKTFIDSGMKTVLPAGVNISFSHEIQATACGDSTVKEYMHGRSLTSGSGSGLPMLVQRTLSQQVSLAECLNSGTGNVRKFGRQIWRGVWHGESVAVKIQYSRDEAIWARETEVYAHLLLSRHDNVLGYVGSDMTSQASCTQLWLVTHFHKSGSLRNYLRQLSEPLSHRQLLDICASVVNGLLYLHTEIQGTQGKSAMAHRNLSSKSIIVKADGTCAIGDLSHVVTQEGLAADKMDLKLISKRYMSPELLEPTYDPRSLETFRAADVYSLGLVFWETCQCCISNGECLKYAAPYSEWLASSEQEPTLEEMRTLVVTNQRRPTIPSHWHQDPMLAEMGALMEECWYPKALSRLPILRVKKTLSKLVAKYTNVELSMD